MLLYAACNVVCPSASTSGYHRADPAACQVPRRGSQGFELPCCFLRELSFPEDQLSFRLAITDRDLHTFTEDLWDFDLHLQQNRKTKSKPL